MKVVSLGVHRLACGGKWLPGTAASRSSSAAAFVDAIVALCEGQTRAQLHPWLSNLNLAEAPQAGSLHRLVYSDTQRSIVDVLLDRSRHEHTLVVNRIQWPHPLPAGVFVWECFELVVARDGHKPSKLCVHVCNS